jgi:hypothetical protein
MIRNSVFDLVGSPIRNLAKYSSLERMLRIYVGLHDRVGDLRADKIYGVERIKIVIN